MGVLMIMMHQVFSILGCMFSIRMWRDGLGRSIFTLTLPQVQRLSKWIVAIQVAIVWGPVFAKLSVCAFILRLVNKTQRAVTILIYVLMVFLTITAVGVTFYLYLQCIPMRKVWDPTAPGKCLPSTYRVKVFQANGGML